MKEELFGPEIQKSSWANWLSGHENPCGQNSMAVLVVVDDILDADSGEVLAEKGQIIDKPLLEEIAEAADYAADGIPLRVVSKYDSYPVWRRSVGWFISQ